MQLSILSLQVTEAGWLWPMLPLKASSSGWSRISFFFRRLGPFLDDPKWLVFVGGWNTILDSKINKGGRVASGLGRYKSSLIDLLAEFDLVDRFRLDPPGRETWTWLGDSPSGQIRSYLDRVLEELTVTSLLVPHSTG